MKKSKVITVIVVLILVTISCAVTISTDPKSSSATAVSTFIPTVEPPQRTAVPTETAKVSRCAPASAIQFDNISHGIKGIEKDNYIKSAWAVKSNDFANVWMVAALVYGDGMENGTGPGVWAMNGNPDEQGLTLSIDGTAINFSVWPDVSTTDFDISRTSDGVAEAVECAKGN